MTAAVQAPGVFDSAAQPDTSSAVTPRSGKIDILCVGDGYLGLADDAIQDLPVRSAFG
ncbi:hypothetical protein [Streptomyces hirsutus]|uniref:hypothetical protein n=1 Tax=Streptomyces hirsutus TaxID=35620 RepID=UPI0012FEC5CA|nr:hypothetical protein [Streptomyces hirsutus]